MTELFLLSALGLMLSLFLGLLRVLLGPGIGDRMLATTFYAGAVATNFKRHENEVVPVYFEAYRLDDNPRTRSALWACP